MEVPVDEPAPTHVIRNFMRKTRRILKASPRQQAVVLAIWALLLIVVFQFSGHLPSTPVNILSCGSPRDQLIKIVRPPKAAPNAALSKLWDGLRIIFEAHPPHPSTLAKPKFNSGNDFPDIESIRHQIDIPASDAEASRASHAEVTKLLQPYPKGLFSGRGIVMLAGGRYSGYAATGLGMLRELGSKLPVEVWMKDEKEEKPGWCDELRTEGMACRRMSDYMNISFMEHGYQLKINSILLSSFEEILFLDADNIPVRKPDRVFDSKGYSDTGVILWRDYWRHSGAPILPYIIGLTDAASEMLIKEEEKTVESGQLMWDKKRHWKSLCLATYYNFYGPQYYYTLINQGWAGWGDKDTFSVALRSLRQEFYTVPHDLKTLFVNGTTHGIGMLQADPTDQAKYEPMFLHSNIVKWGIRAFFCIGCASDDSDTVTISALERLESPINLHLKEHHRIFKEEDMKLLGIDPEPLIWKSMEFTACQSVWKDASLCERTREHMEKTFGTRFQVGRIADLLGYSDRVCAMND